MANEVVLPEVGPLIEKMKEKFAAAGDQLIPMLQHLQTEMGYLPNEGLTSIADYLKVPASHVYGVATFYAQFRFKPLGFNRITVCRGTACHVRGSQRLLDEIEREMKIKAGDTTPDLMFSLQTVACLGSCAQAPVVVVNDKVYGKMTSKAAKKIISQVGAEKTAPAAPPAPSAKAEDKKAQPEKKAAAQKPAPESKKPAAKKPAAKKAGKSRKKK
ncbi:MAG TPA: NADH-quinone oxidoreductase subunit NuoE [bacterium]|nr:NADH-quinone oxidoreductase subunit NuoE [bacterium]